VLIPFGGKVSAADDPDVIESIATYGGVGSGQSSYIKVKDTVYFTMYEESSSTSGLIAYNIKTGKKRKLSNNIATNIEYYKGYIYGCSVKYSKKGNSQYSLYYSLYRVNVKNGKETKLVSDIASLAEYNIFDDKLYVSVDNKKTDYAYIYSLNLDGTNKKKIISKYFISGGDGCNFTVRENYIIFHKGLDYNIYSYNMTTKKTVKLFNRKLLNEDYDYESYYSSDKMYYCYKAAKTNKYVYVVKNYDGKVIKTYKSKKKYEAALKLAKKEDNFESYYTYRSSDSETTTHDVLSKGGYSWISGNKEYSPKSWDSSKIYCKNTTTNKEKCIYKANATKYKGKKVISNTVTIGGVTGNYLVVQDRKETATKYITDYKLITSSGKVITTLYTRTDKK
jgi:hypothetical protein